MKTLRSRVATFAAAAVVAGSTALIGAPASTAAVSTAGGGTPVTLPVTGEAFLAKRNTTLHLPAGAKMVGTLAPDLTVTGELTIPETTAKMRILNIPKIGDTTSTVRIVGTAPTITKIDAKNGLAMTVTNKFRIELPRVSSDLLPKLNIVLPTCRTKEITATMTGYFKLSGPSAISGTFDIPAFEKCGYSIFGLPSARDLLLTELISGPNNTMNLQVGPLS